jgi:hypothetical protein
MQIAREYEGKFIYLVCLYIMCGCGEKNEMRRIEDGVREETKRY